MAETPDFRWSAFYYPEILAGLIELKRSSWPEHTEEDQTDPVIQLYRAFSVVAHLQAVRLDHAAREVFLPTARLRASFIAMGRLVDYELATAVPAESYLVATVSGTLATAKTLVRAHSTFTTVGDSDTPAVVFEYDADADLVGGPNDATAFRVLEDDGGVVTDVTGALPLSLFAGTAAKNDALYLMGDPVLAANKLDLEISVGSAQPWFRYEYRDDRSGEPDTVVDNGGTITLGVDSVIGSDTTSPNGGEATGLEVTVTCLRTGVSEVLEVDGLALPNTVETTGLLGQTTVSTSAADYKIETLWVELGGIVDETAGLVTVDTGTLSFTLPHSTDRRWLASDPEGLALADGYWFRARLARAGTASSPTLDSVAVTRKTTWAVTWPVRQGRRVTDKLGTTDGTAAATFELNRSPFMELVELTVDADAWTEVDNFLASASYDRHFTLEEQADGAWLVTFGDGTNGRIPTTSLAVVAVYRVGGDTSGNVGADTINKDRTGNARIKAVTNPQAATGWKAQEGTTDDSLDDLRVEIPASLRTRSRAVTPEDCETLAGEFTTADGSTVTTRSLAVEEHNGPKTIGLICVGPGGVAPPTADLVELDAYFNGETKGLQRIGGVLLANSELTSEAFIPLAIAVTVTVTVLADYSPGAQAKVEGALAALLSPTATRLVQDTDGLWIDSGIFLWEWEGDVDPSVLLGAIYTSTPGIVGIAMSAPAAPTTLAVGELPVSGAIAVTIVTL